MDCLDSYHFRFESNGEEMSESPVIPEVDTNNPEPQGRMDIP